MEGTPDPRHAGKRSVAVVSLQPDSFSVVIPAVNEAAIIGAAVTDARAHAGVAEVLVVDGGSRDATLDEARAAGARVLCSPCGRGAQMNAGARAARASTLLFLHADCRLPRDAVVAMRDVLARGYHAGTFAIDYGSPHPVLRMVSWLSRLQAPWTEFGEAGLFVRRWLFERLGGYPEWPVFEDVEMLARLRRAGPLGRARGQVRASPRRYQSAGVWRQQFRNAGLYLLYQLGVPPRRLARAYDQDCAHSSPSERVASHGEKVYGSDVSGSPLNCLPPPVSPPSSAIGR